MVNLHVSGNGRMEMRSFKNRVDAKEFFEHVAAKSESA